MRLPETGPKRDAYIVQIGTDGYRLLDALAEKDAPAEAAALPAVAVLRRVWARHFERDEDGRDGEVPRKARLRPVHGRGPGDRIEPPCDADAQYRSKFSISWTGTMVHLTETCDEGAPYLVLHADTTPANVHEAMRIEAIHAALADKDLTPSEHLVDAAYISADHLVRAREQHSIDLVGPARPRTGWQNRTEGAYGSADFTVDWEHQAVRCPEGHASRSWGEYTNKATGPHIRVRFDPANCDACPSKPRCTHGHGRGRQLTLSACQQHEVLAAARVRGDTEQG